jgi:hypothetical protein
MSDPKTREKLASASSRIWSRYRSGKKLKPADRQIMREAYYVNVLPQDRDFSVTQWVEDGFPDILF